MKLWVKRLIADAEGTVGVLFVDSLRQGFTLEDAFHEGKIPGRTRIPAGVYDIQLRFDGGRGGVHRGGNRDR